jgi:hypothetical protein
MIDVAHLLQQYLGDEATIVITPAQPIKATMDDGSVLKYSKLSAHYKMVGGNPMLTIDQPQPQAFVKKWGLWFEADIQGAKGDLGATPPTAMLKTSRGDYKVKVGLEPQ